MSGDPSTSPVFQAPYALSLIVCDQVITDETTKKPSIIGCFTSISALQFPCTHPRMTIFAEITDGLGEIPMIFRIVDVDEEQELFSAKVSFPMDDPLLIGRIVFPIPPIVFPAPGEYRLQLVAGDDPLMERRIMLLQMEEESNAERESND